MFQFKFPVKAVQQRFPARLSCRRTRSQTLWLVFFVCILHLYTGASTALAHEFLIKPEGWHKLHTGQKLPLSVYSTHFFIKGEEVEDPALVKVTYNGAEVPLTVNQSWLTHDGVVTLQNTGTAIIAGHRLPILWSETPRGDAEGGRLQNTDALRASRYEKFSKLLLPVGESTDNFATIAGHRLEIVPVDNPLTAKPGDEILFRVLLDGTPALFETMQATYDGFTDTGAAWAYMTAPVIHGQGIVKITAPGLWIIHVSVTLPNKTPDFDEEILKATLLFPVRP